MFVYGSDFFLLKPGALLVVLGLLLTVPVSVDDLDLGPFALSLNWQFLGVTVLAVGWQAFLLGCIAQVLFDYTGRHTRRWRRVFPYTRTVLVSAALVAVGLALSVPLLVTYVGDDFALSTDDTVQNHLAVTGLAAVIVGAQLFRVDARAARHDPRHRRATGADAGRPDAR